MVAADLRAAESGVASRISAARRSAATPAESFRMNILVTGGAGYIGSLLVPSLLGAGHAVTVLDNFLFRQASLMDCCHYPDFHIVRGDCRDERVVKPLLASADLTIPLAALVGAP